MMNNILQNQNKPENLKKLAAQRQLYIIAKKYFMMQIWFTVPITVVLAILKLIPESVLGFNASYVASFFGIIITIADILVGYYVVSDFRTKAANIQEQFDCDVFEMPWNKILIPKRVTIEIINRFAKQYVDDPKKPLTDWYPLAIKDLSKEQAICVCQKSSLHYDRTLRSKLIRITSLISGSILLMLILISLVEALTLINFLVLVLAPFAPVLYLTLRIGLENKKSIKESNDGHAIITSFSSSKEIPIMTDLRQLQDKIYINRKNSPLIPEFFYKKKRVELEEEMNDNVIV
jgi:hypothetical protein